VSDREIILKGRLNGIQRNRLKSLFDMLYSPRELAEELSINQDQVYLVYVPLGCPHERDVRNHILINGKEFAEWYIRVYAKMRLGANQTFCKTCKKGVLIHNGQKKQKGTLIYLQSTCPNCGRGLTKILSAKGFENDK